MREHDTMIARAPIFLELNLPDTNYIERVLLHVFIVILFLFRLREKQRTGVEMK